VGLPVEVPGLDTIIPDVGEGRLVVVESGPDPAKGFFVRQLGRTALRLGWPVSFVISRDRRELEDMFTAEGTSLPDYAEQFHVVEQNAIHAVDGFGQSGGLLAVDSFSFLTLELPGDRLAPLLRSLRELGREQKTTIVLATDRGMFTPSSEAVTSHLADGVIQFHAKEATEGIVRFIRIPKWTNGRFVDRNIYYDFDGKRIAIDLRRRVL
jgi:KaiC/GvpD/RAD55 family RecA-like ATPase